MARPNDPLSVSGFNVLPIQYSKTSTHYLYARAHQSKSSSLPANRTLFLVNIPPDATERELISLYRSCGIIERVVFDTAEDNEDNGIDESSDEESDEDEVTQEQDGPPRKKQKVGKASKAPPAVVPLPSKLIRSYRKTGQSAHVVFLDEAALPKALSLGTKTRPWPKLQDADAPPIGLAHYANLYASLRPPLDVVRQHADSSIERYEYEVDKHKQKSKYKKGEAIVDDDGFTLVTRGGAYGKTLGGGVGVASKNFHGRGGPGRMRNKKKESKEKSNFYAFQKAEKQRQDLLDLKRKWEEDKAKVEGLKASRRFKPY